MASYPRADPALARATGTFAFVLCCVASIAACNGLTGAGELTANGLTDSPDANPVFTTPDGDGGGGADVSVQPEPPKGCPSAGRRCAPSPPAGWAGPLILYDGPQPDVPLCPPNMAFQRVNAGVGKPTGTISCSNCNCGDPDDVNCSATLHQYADVGCATAATTTSAINTTCVPIAAGTLAVRITTTASGGNCDPSGGNPIKGPVTWPGTLRACGALNLLPDGCESGQVCTPEPVAPFRAQHCISYSGDQPCPAPWTDKHLGNQEFTDARDCTNCTCKPPTGVTCGATLRYSATSATCDLPTVSRAVPLSCLAVAAGSSGKFTPSGLDHEGGSCAKGEPAQPTGEITERDPLTVCCLP